MTDLSQSKDLGVVPLARSYPIPSPTHAGAMASASCRVSPSAAPTTQRGKYPISNAQYPISKWCACLASALTSGINEGNWPVRREEPSHCTHPRRAPLGHCTLGVGYWILDILFSCWSRILYWTPISLVVWHIKVKLKKLRMQVW
jgi:hypothetical protein